MSLIWRKFEKCSKCAMSTVTGVVAYVIKNVFSHVRNTDRMYVCLLQFRPVAVKQGTETSGSSSRCNSEMPLHTDEVRIENFSLDDKQRRLRQAFVTRFVLFSGYCTTTTTVITSIATPDFLFIYFLVRSYP